MRKVPIIFVFICGLCGGIFAAAGSTPVFDAGIGVKAQALGNAYIAGTDDSSAVFYNPSALYTLDRTEIQAAFIPLFLDTYYSYLAGGIPTANYGVFAFSAAMINTDNIQYRDSEGAPLGG